MVTRQDVDNDSKRCLDNITSSTEWECLVYGYVGTVHMRSM